MKLTKFLERNKYDFLLGLILGIIYLNTLLPGVGYSGDTAKFQFVGKILGIPHAPGFPTYVFINHFFTKFFPIGSLAYKANLLSAIFSVLCCIFLFHILTVLNIDKVISFITSLTFGLTYTMWTQSIIAEVYSLNIMFVAMIIYFLIIWRKTEDIKYLFISIFIFAISLGNHLSIVTFLPAIIFFIWVINKKVLFSLKNISFFTLLIIIGFSQYLYILWRINDPNLIYTEANISNFRDFFDFVTGGYFKNVLFCFPIKTIIFKRIPFFLKSFLREYHFVIPIGIFGIVSNLKRRPFFIFLLLAGFTNLFLIINYNIIPAVKVYFIPIYFIFAIYLGLGINKLFIIWNDRKRKFNSFLMLITIPLIFLLANYSKVDQSGNMKSKEIESMLQLVEKNSIIISPNYDYSEYFWYYLKGGGLQETNNIFLLHTTYHSIEWVSSFINNVPDNVDIYCIDTKSEDDINKDAFKKAGFKVLKVKDNLYIVKP